MEETWSMGIHPAQHGGVARAVHVKQWKVAGRDDDEADSAVAGGWRWLVGVAMLADLAGIVSGNPSGDGWPNGVADRLNGIALLLQDATRAGVLLAPQLLR